MSKVVYELMMEDVKKENRSYESLVEEGLMSELDAFIYFKGMIKALEDEIAFIKSWIKDNNSYISSQIQDNNKEYKGFKFEVRQGATKWDYSGIGDLEDANNRLKMAKDDVKKIQDRYKAYYNASMQGSTPISEDGEVIPLPSKTIGDDILIMKSK